MGENIIFYVMDVAKVRIDNTKPTGGEVFAAFKR